MNKTLLAMLAIALAAPCAFAADGQVLINQSTVMAAGGFPYVINQPGSYKLSGNLTLNTTQVGDFLGGDVAILIGTGNVTLDLNGFTIFVNDAIGDLTHQIYAIAELGQFESITIRNGKIQVRSPQTLGKNLNGIYLKTSRRITLQDLDVRISDSEFGISITSGLATHVDHVHVGTDMKIDPYACLVENSVALTPAGCKGFNNTESIFGTG